jgi:hypothetical protein
MRRSDGERAICTPDHSQRGFMGTITTKGEAYVREGDKMVKWKLYDGHKAGFEVFASAVRRIQNRRDVLARRQWT